MTTLRLRPEGPADAAPIRQVLAAAFARPDARRPPEVGLVDDLRAGDAWLPELSMVGESGGEIVGYALLTRVRVRPDGGAGAGARPGRGGTAPPAGRPRYGGGAGRARRRHELGEELVVVLGAPAFYRRFGFVPAPAWADQPVVRARRPVAGPAADCHRRPRRPGRRPGEVLFPAPWCQV